MARLVVRCGVFGSLPVSAYAVAQAAGIDPIRWSRGLDLARARSTLGNASFLGAYLVLVVPLALALVVDRDETGHIRWAAGVPLVLGLAALLATQSRAAWLGATASLAIVCWMNRGRLRSTTSRLVVLAGVVVVVLAVGVSGLGGRAASIADPASGTAGGRLQQWRLTTRLVAQRPLTGWGPDSFAAAFPRVIDDHYERTVGRATVPDRAHNNVLDMAESSGVPAAVAFVCLLGIALRRGWRERRTSLDGVIVAAAAGYVVQQIFGFPLADVDVVFWLLLGMAVAAEPGRAPVGGGYRNASRSTRSAPIDRRVSAAFVATALVASMWAGSAVLADRQLRMGADEDAAGRATAAAAHLAHVARLTPERASAWVSLARADRLAGDDGAALVASSHARRLSPYDPEVTEEIAEDSLDRAERTTPADQPNAYAIAERALRSALHLDQSSAQLWLTAGVLYAEENHDSDAGAAFYRAADLDPRTPEPWIDLALLRQRSGDAAGALDAYRKALAIDPSNARARAAMQVP